VYCTILQCVSHVYNAYYTAVSYDMSRRTLGRGNTIIAVLFLRVNLLCSGTASLGTSSMLPVSENPPNSTDRRWTISGNSNLSVVSTCVGIMYVFALCKVYTYIIYYWNKPAKVKYTKKLEKKVLKQAGVMYITVNQLKLLYLYCACYTKKEGYMYNSFNWFTVI